MARPHAAPDVFRAIAHPVRRSILQRLHREGPLSVSTIAQPIRMSVPSVSNHIQILRVAGLIVPQPSGRELHYSVVSRRLGAVDKWMQTMK
ncbi:MAG: ArsR/SmtB family transcription factor [Phycisphaerales bacterium]